MLRLGRYAAMEFGVLAHEWPEKTIHHINSAGYKIEVLSLTEDIPAGEGEVGRLVVTDLYSYAMPLIRYETGDLAVLSGVNACDCGRKGPVLLKLEGRESERIYDTAGSPVSPLAISIAARCVDGIMQYQFVQTGERTYAFKLVPGPDLSTGR